MRPNCSATRSAFTLLLLLLLTDTLSVSAWITRGVSQAYLSAQRKETEPKEASSSPRPPRSVRVVLERIHPGGDGVGYALREGNDKDGETITDEESVVSAAVDSTAVLATDMGSFF